MLIALLLALVVGLGAWAYANRGYPDVVYYMRFRFTTSAGADVRELYVDPRRQVMRTSVVGRNYGGTLWVSDCYYPTYGMSSASDCNPLSESTMQEEATTYQDVRRGGLAGLGDYLLACRTGHLLHLLFHGRPALRFVATSASILSLFSPSPAVIWLDARSRMLLKVQVGSPDGNA